MRGKRAENKSQLLFRQGFFGQGCQTDAQAALLHRVFGRRNPPDDDAWRTFAAFTPDGTCVATAEARVLTLLVEGSRRPASGLRQVGVDPDWRGLGLFRDLMTYALAWCEAESDGPILLFTEEPALYRRFGFELCPQHAFVGPTRAFADDVAVPSRRNLDAANKNDLEVIRQALATREPVSRRCALVDAPDIAMRAIAAMSDVEIVSCPSLGAVVLLEQADDNITLVDVIAPRMPTLKALFAALALRPAPRQLTTLFAPDRLAWPEGRPIPDATGLMIRGPCPPVLMRPFMLPPTAEF